MLYNPLSKVLFFAGIVFVISSCGKRSGPRYEDPVYTHTLQKIGEYEIEIDSVTAPNFVHYQYFQNDGKEYFTMLNRISQEINFYDLDSKKLAFKIPLIYEGPNSVGNLQGFNSGYFIHTLDSVFVLNRSYGRLYLINGNNSQIIDEYVFEEDGQTPTPVIAPHAPMFVNNNQAYLLNIQQGIEYFDKNDTYNSNYASVINLENKSQSKFLSYPEVFSEGAWGFELHKLGWALNTTKNEIVVNYAIDDSIYVHDLNGKLKSSHMAKSLLVPRPKSIGRNQNDYNGRKMHLLSQGKYDQIYYDPIRDIYLRDCISPLSEEDIFNGVIHNYERSTVLLNGDFEKIGEIAEPTRGRLVLFFREDGIHKFVPTENENSLHFEIYGLFEN